MMDRLLVIILMVTSIFVGVLEMFDTYTRGIHPIVILLFTCVVIIGAMFQESQELRKQLDKSIETERFVHNILRPWRR